MGAYRVRLLRHRCVVCKGKATYEVINTLNSSCEHYCTKHSKQRVRELDEASPADKITQALINGNP